jgi:hypothetical protein
MSNFPVHQESLFDLNNQPPYPGSAAEKWDLESVKHSLDELFLLTSQYSSSANYMKLLDFVKRFPHIAPYNAMLAHIQMPGATFILSPYKWRTLFGRTIKPGARPIVILRTMGPVDFVFDVSDTEGRPLPPHIENSFAVREGNIGKSLPFTEEYCKRDGVYIYKSNLGSTRGGSLRVARTKRDQHFRDKPIPVAFELEVSERMSPEQRYATITHELGHLYCGHLGTINPLWWPDRRGLSHSMIEFEAESVSYLVCKRFGLDIAAEEYLAGYVGSQPEVPPISLECVMKAAGLIEKMGKERMKLRKTK